MRYATYGVMIIYRVVQRRHTKLSGTTYNPQPRPVIFIFVDLTHMSCSDLEPHLLQDEGSDHEGSRDNNTHLKDEHECSCGGPVHWASVRGVAVIRGKKLRPTMGASRRSWRPGEDTSWEVALGLMVRLFRQTPFPSIS
jgi:hypothetical protein